LVGDEGLTRVSGWLEVVGNDVDGRMLCVGGGGGMEVVGGVGGCR
ncbi:hypothetical protein Tco_0645232, partial [Tanacetum coccineum]